ncbi:MAG TPA: hypothetical protein VE964_13255, partial [Myxococcales bacterium]|nr:hypothetical protein [Myxococcales bacterium]
RSRPRRRRLVPAGSPAGRTADARPTARAVAVLTRESPPRKIVPVARIADDSLVHFAASTERIGDPYRPLCGTVRRASYYRPAPADSAHKCPRCLSALRRLVLEGSLEAPPWLTLRSSRPPTSTLAAKSPSEPT